ncbi:hypothetical protein HPC62_18210 [Thermoleptolyngbya sichuanensis A183]|uniref:Type I restriction enzyme R protein N-terminal domain-containing protein n=1 Tax=Thermoleptolyngbya sichuanensis A183 TaxID=2737172 RepID=A0A6M8BG66_9CYAN|nr:MULTISPECIES: hypothetical protein [Thermoleptolyngbya]QKD83867.1 hypothetical protein HPC62_18210 [Thermoleptolyngbya sichuanensis A183]
MPKAPILQPDQSYMFADYFRLNFAPRDILAHFGVTLQKRAIAFSPHRGELDRLDSLQQRIEESLPRLSLTSEAARREFLIAPVLTDVLHYTQALLNVEYPVAVSNQLKGSLDYFLQTDVTVLVIEAKNEDLERGFVQLAVELIALDQWIESEQGVLPGAVSTGSIWQFGQFDRQTRQVTQDLNLYRVPADLEALLRILVGLLKPAPGDSVGAEP